MAAAYVGEYEDEVEVQVAVQKEGGDKKAELIEREADAMMMVEYI